MENGTDNNENWRPKGEGALAGDEAGSGRTSVIVKATRVVFGVFMALVYIGMGILLIINFFDWEQGNWTWTRYLVGVVLVVYGFWRGWRQYKGLDYYGR